MALGAVSGQGPGCALLGGEEDEVWAPGKVPGRDEAEQIAPRVNWSWELHPWSSRTSATPRNLHLAPAWCRWEGASASPAATGWALPCFHGRRAGRKPGGRPTIDVFVPGNSDEFTHEQSPLRLRQPDRMGKNCNYRGTATPKAHMPWKQHLPTLKEKPFSALLARLLMNSCVTPRPPVTAW